MINLGLLGGAHILTPNFIERLAKRDSFRVKSVWDHDADRATRRATALGASIVPTPEALLSDPEIHAVIVCSETNRHEPLVLAAAAA